MLLEFKVENYKSFRDETTFSMIPAKKQKGLDYAILQEPIGRGKIKALSAAVIYGANAAGKSNLIGAMQTLKSIILKGNILNSSITSLNAADDNLELIPNNTLKEKKPVYFFIRFIHNKILFSYSLTLDLGEFLSEKLKRAVCEEILTVNDKIIFKRQDKTLEIDTSFASKFINSTVKEEKNKEVSESIALESLNEYELFLTNGFKNIISNKLSNIIIEYFSAYFETFYHTEWMNDFPELEKQSPAGWGLNEAAREFGINSNELIYLKPKDGQKSVLCSVIDEKTVLPSAVFESYGTLRFISIYPLIVKALVKGSALIIDELDASIHPMAILSLINVFHNDEINKNNAQLIFNTHNPIYLNGNVLRRDEIKFVEREEATGCSKHYSLSDFGTKGTTARKGKDYMNNYFVNEYGAIRNIDLTDVFQKIMKSREQL